MSEIGATSSACPIPNASSYVVNLLCMYSLRSGLIELDLLVDHLLLCQKFYIE